MAKSIYVGNLPWSATEEQVQNLFAEYGDVLSVKLVSDRRYGPRPRFRFCRNGRARRHRGHRSSGQRLVRRPHPARERSQAPRSASAPLLIVRRFTRRQFPSRPSRDGFFFAPCPATIALFHPGARFPDRPSLPLTGHSLPAPATMDIACRPCRQPDDPLCRRLCSPGNSGGKEKPRGIAL